MPVVDSKDSTDQARARLIVESVDEIAAEALALTEIREGMRETGLTEAGLMNAAATTREEILRPANTALEALLTAYRAPDDAIPPVSAALPPASTTLAHRRGPSRPRV